MNISFFFFQPYVRDWMQKEKKKRGDREWLWFEARASQERKRRERRFILS